MSASKRKCATCKYFQVSPVSGQGWCTQPTRQTSNDVRLLVRKDELNCRNSWGNDLWVDASAPDTAVQPITPTPPVNDMVLPYQKLDDEITSVVSTDATSRLDLGEGIHVEETTQRDDVVVREASLVPETVNAISTPEATDENIDDSPVVAHDNSQSFAEGPTANEREAALNARDRLRRRRTIHFDFNPSASEASPDTSAIAENVNGSSGVDRTSQREISQPSRPAVKQGTDDAGPVASAGSDHRQEKRTSDKLYDSVPDIDPEFELPRAKRPSVAQNRNVRPRNNHDTNRGSQPISSYDAALERAQKFRSSAQGQPAGWSNERLPLAPAVQPEPRVDLPHRDPPRRAAAKSEPVLERPSQVHREPIVSADMSASSSPVTYRPTTRTPQFDVESLVRRNITFQRAQPAPEQVPDEVEHVPTATAGDQQRSARTRRRLGFPLRRESSQDRARSSEPVVDAPMVQAQAFEPEGLTYLDDEVPDLDIAQPIVEPLSTRPAQERARPEQPAARSLYGKKSDIVQSNGRDPRNRTASSRSVRQNQVPVTREETPDLIVEPRDAQTSAGQHRSVQPHADVQVPEHQAQSAVRTSSSDSSPTSWSFEPLPDLRHESGMRELRSRIGINSSANSGASSRAEETIQAAQGRRIIEDQIVARRSPANEIDPLHRTSAFRASTFSIRESVVDIPESERGYSQKTRLPAGPAPYSGELDDAFDQPSPETDTDTDFDIRDALWFDEEEVTPALQLAPDVPRQCQTCRDYRPAESGGRGWCTNGWAFEHRQMVNASDLACQSTIGCWWLPFDDVWLPDEPESTPTPLVAKMVTAALERRRSS